MPAPNMTLPTVRHRRTPETQMSVTKPGVETGSGNNFRTETDGEAIETVTPTFSTMPDPNMTLPTLADISNSNGGHETGSENRKWK